MTQRTVETQTGPVAEPPPAEIAPPLEPPVAATEAPEAPPAPPPDPHPVVDSFARRAAAWAPALEAKIGALELTGTGYADTTRMLVYLRHRLLSDILVPALKLSYDPTVRGYREALERSALFDEAHPLANLRRGTEQPQACRRCAETETACPPRCERERRLFHPAVLAATELDSNLAFAGHRPGASLEPEQDVPFEQFLDAVLATGLAREKVEAAVLAILEDLVLRGQGVEGPLPAQAAGGQAGHEALMLGYQRWESTYAAQREPSRMISEPIMVGVVEHLEAFSRFEQAILVRVPALGRHALALKRYRAQLVAIEKGELAATDAGERPAVDCTKLRPSDARRCAEATIGLHALELHVSEVVLAADQLVDGALAIRVGLALEHLSLGGLTVAQIDSAYAQLLADLSRRGSPRVEL